MHQLDDMLRKDCGICNQGNYWNADVEPHSHAASLPEEQPAGPRHERTAAYQGVRPIRGRDRRSIATQIEACLPLPLFVGRPVNWSPPRMAGFLLASLRAPCPRSVLPEGWCTIPGRAPGERFRINKIVPVRSQINRGSPMPTSQDYRQQADECLAMTNKANEWYVRMALLQLAAEFKKRAENLEQRRAA
jgi:hypothetical protein